MHEAVLPERRPAVGGTLLPHGEGGLRLPAQTTGAGPGRGAGEGSGVRAEPRSVRRRVGVGAPKLWMKFVKGMTSALSAVAPYGRHNVSLRNLYQLIPTGGPL